MKKTGKQITVTNELFIPSGFEKMALIMPPGTPEYDAVKHATQYNYINSVYLKREGKKKGTIFVIKSEVDHFMKSKHAKSEKPKPKEKEIIYNDECEKIISILQYQNKMLLAIIKDFDITI